MRSTTKAMQFIKIQAQYFDLNSKQLYTQTKSLLNIYRNVVWSVKTRANNLEHEIAGTYGMQHKTALMYLSDFAPEKAKAEFEMTVSNLFQSQWLIKLIDLSLQYVCDYPIYGETYSQILRLRFMDETKRNDNTVSEILSLERSTYYERKKEAILLLGISLWGFVVPNTLETYKRVSYLSVSETDFFTMVTESQKKKIMQTNI